MKRLYVLLSKDLDPIYAGVQGGHAVAQWLIDNKDTQIWNNEYLIYLTADLNEWIIKLKIKELNFSVFKEPDLNDKITAIAIVNEGKIFKGLKKLGE